MILLLWHNNKKKLARQGTIEAALLRTRHLGAHWRRFGNSLYAAKLFTLFNALGRCKAPYYVFCAQDKHLGRITKMETCSMA